MLKDVGGGVMGMEIWMLQVVLVVVYVYTEGEGMVGNGKTLLEDGTIRRQVVLEAIVCRK